MFVPKAGKLLLRTLGPYTRLYSAHGSLYQKPIVKLVMRAGLAVLSEVSMMLLPWCSISSLNICCRFNAHDAVVASSRLLPRDSKRPDWLMTGTRPVNQRRLYARCPSVEDILLSRVTWLGLALMLRI